MTENQKSSDTHLEENNMDSGFIDKRVGSRIRLRRRLLGFSQEKLALALGLSFQQVQKYEKGTNRVGASRLYDIAQILQVPINFFFDKLSNPAYEQELHDSNKIAFAAEVVHEIVEDDSIVVSTSLHEGRKVDIFELMNNKETANLLKAYYNIQEPEVRQKLLHLIRAMGASN